MADIETLPASTRYFTEVSAPSTPSSGEGVLYAATDGTLHYLNDAATDTELGSGGGASAIDDLSDVDTDKSKTPEDGDVLTFDGTDWNAEAAAGGSSVVSARAKRTSGDITLNSTTWANVDTGMDLTVAAASGDILLVHISGLYGQDAVNAAMDAATIVSASPVNYIGTGGGASDLGVQGWIGLSGVSQPVGGSVQYAVQAGDISSGNVTLRLRYRTTSAANKTLRASATQPLQWGVVNLGQ